MGPAAGGPVTQAPNLGVSRRLGSHIRVEVKAATPVRRQAVAILAPWRLRTRAARRRGSLIERPIVIVVDRIGPKTE